MGAPSAPAPWARSTLNDRGESAFSFVLDPLQFPFGVNAGLYVRPSGGSVTGLVRPGVTAVPGGGVFRGAFEAAINASRQVAFTALVDTNQGLEAGIGSGVWLAGSTGSIAKVAAPGDLGPGGTIDFAGGPSINTAGDVAYSAHVVGDEPLCFVGFIDCAASVFVRRGGTGTVETVARQGTPAPGGALDETFLFGYEPLVNNVGDVLFFGRTNPFLDGGLFIRSGGEYQRIAGSGIVPGVGNYSIDFPTFRAWAPNYAFNSRRQVAFIAGVASATDFLGPFLLRWEKGRISVVAEPGAKVPGVGTIATFVDGGVLMNESGQILVQALLEDGRVVLLRIN